MQVKTPILQSKDVMRRNVVTIDGMATVREAIAKMRSENVTSLIVNKRDPSDAWGIVTITDLVREIIAPGRPPDDTNVYEIMTKPLITVPPDMDIRYVARLLYRVGVRRAPVEAQGELLGMISLSDLVLGKGVL
ncbi:MAG: CBS domain-containing protein [Deltaproteobacteria bacterium]|nr:CBS domain-containing protein [Deltaproteobacteria bacterium]